MKTILLAIALTVVALGQTTSPIRVDGFDWTGDSDDHYENIAVGIVNTQTVPITDSLLMFDLFSSDGTKVGERMATMNYLAPGQRGLYSALIIPSVESVSIAYIKIGRFQGVIQGVGFTISPNKDLAETRVYSPSIVRGEQILEAEERQQAEKERKKEDKKRKKAERDAAKDDAKD